MRCVLLLGFVTRSKPNTRKVLKLGAANNPFDPERDSWGEVTHQLLLQHVVVPCGHPGVAGLRTPGGHSGPITYGAHGEKSPPK